MGRNFHLRRRNGQSVSVRGKQAEPAAARVYPIGDDPVIAFLPVKAGVVPPSIRYA